MSIDREKSKEFKSAKYKSKGGFVVKVGLLTITMFLPLILTSNTYINVEEDENNIDLNNNYIFETLQPCKMDYPINHIDESVAINYEYLLIEEESQSIKNRILNEVNDSNSIFINHDSFKISEELLNKINNLISSYPDKSAFYIVTLDGSMSMGYNIDYSFPSASAVKAPYALYCVKEIEKNNIDFNEEIVYEPKHYEIDTSIINDYPFYKKFTLDQILYYTIHESDNAGYYMLQDRFHIDGYNKMLSDLGCKNMFLNGIKWGNVNARDMLVIWNEIDRYSKVSEVGNKYLDILKGAKYNFIKQGLDNNYVVAHKSGFNSQAKHDVGIVYGDIPYLVTIMSKNPNDKNYYFIHQMASYLDEAVNEYKNYISKQKILY